MSLKLQHENLSEVIKKIPHKPGVYRYYAESGELLYVGKAVDLNKRVTSYFRESSVYNQRMYLMVNQIHTIEYTLVKNEKEALLLEANLIHSLQPKFNILLKDEQNYLYIRFTYSDAIPGIFIDRKKTSPKFTYYGPFFSRGNITRVLRAIRMVLPYCEKREYDGKPCEYVALGQCDGVCIHQELDVDYRDKLQQIEHIFQGKTEQVESFIEHKIEKAVYTEQYELAAFWRDRLKLLKSMFLHTLGEQRMVLTVAENLDIVTLVLEEGEGGIGSVFVQTIREGKMINVNNFLLAGGDAGTTADLVQDYLERFLTSYYIFQKNEYPVLIQSFIEEKT